MMPQGDQYNLLRCFFLQWTQLRTRRDNLVHLFEKMQNYQFDQNSDPDQVLASNVRPLTDEDVER